MDLVFNVLISDETDECLDLRVNFKPMNLEEGN